MAYQTVNDLALLLARYGVGALISYTRTLIVLMKPDGTLLERNPAFGQFKESLPAATVLQDLISASSQPLFDEMLQAAFQGEDARRGTLELLIGDGYGNYECLLIPLPDGNVLFLAEAVSKPQSDEVAKLTRDLQETKRALHVKQTGLEAVLAQVDEIAHTDQLTFLSNQRKIIGDLQRKVTTSSHSRKPLTIFMVDIDRFKPINDTYGHVVGDQVLRALAGDLRNGIRHSDHIGRYGGEEFLILLPRTPWESAIPVAERLLKVARALTVETNGQVVRLTISIGIAQYHPGETWKEFLERADKALYQSKNSGRDRWSVSKIEKSKKAPAVQQKSKPEE
jgi:diguanylate cyclase (GGDEF)-like protein